MGIARDPIRSRPRLLARRLRERRVAGRVSLRYQRNHVGKLGHRVEIAERREPLEPERVELVAEQQRKIAIVGSHDRAATP